MFDAPLQDSAQPPKYTPERLVRANASPTRPGPEGSNRNEIVWVVSSLSPNSRNPAAKEDIMIVACFPQAECHQG